MNNLLIITPFLPYPLNTGGHQAVFTSIDTLRFDYNIYLLYRENNQSKLGCNTLEILWPEVKLLSYSPEKRFQNMYDFWNKLHNKISQIFFTKHYKLDRIFKNYDQHYSNNYISYINDIISKNKIDIVQIEFIPNLSLICALPKSVKKVFVHHELRFSIHELFMDELNLTSPYYRYRYNYLKHAEINLLSLYDSIITLSDIDAKKLQNEGIATKVFSSFAMVRKNSNEAIFIKQFKKCLTFVGGEFHAPNKIGLEWFIKNCWAKILNEDCNLHLKIIGQWSRSTQKKWCEQNKNIEFLGFVDNLFDVLTGSVMIIPITIGSGIRMKILECANMGIPFVTTRIGVEGLPFVDNEDCFICDETEEFINKVLKLKNDLTIQNQFAISANNKINSLFSFEKLKESRVIVYDSIMNK